MTVEEKLKRRLSLFPSTERDKHSRTLGEYLMIKQDMQLIKQPIDSPDVISSLVEAHSIVEDTTKPVSVRKKAMLDSIRIYRQIVTSSKKEELQERWNYLLDERLLKGVLEKVINALGKTQEDYNMVVGLVKTYYDMNKTLISDVLSPGLVENESVWAYENLEDSIMVDDIDTIDDDKLVKILNTSKNISLNYIVALYNSSKIVCQLSKISNHLDEIETYLSSMSYREAINKTMKRLKTGTATIAYETQKKEKVEALKKELNKFNCLILDVKRW